MDILTKIITEYGPLGFGWILAVYFIRENKDLHRKFQEMAESNIKARMAFTEKMEGLTAIIKKGFGE